MSIDQSRQCRWCGARDTEIEAHHLYRRSLRPDLIDDPKNLIDLCKWKCHKRATDRLEFELKLQKTFYPNPPEFMATNTPSQCDPHTWDEENGYLCTNCGAIKDTN